MTWVFSNVANLIQFVNRLHADYLIELVVRVNSLVNRLRAVYGLHILIFGEHLGVGFVLSEELL